MYWIFDNILAFIIAGILLFVLFTLGLRSQDASIETTQFDSAKSEILNFTSILKQDLNNVGAGYLMPAGGQIDIDTTSTVKHFEFWTRTDRLDPEPVRVAYRWQETGEQVTLNSDETTLPRMRFERRVGSGGSWETLVDNTLVDFRVTLRRGDLQIINSSDPAALATTRRIDVSLRMIAPLGKGDLIEVVRWAREFRPLNLQRQQGSLLVE